VLTIEVIIISATLASFLWDGESSTTVTRSSTDRATSSVVSSAPETSTTAGSNATAQSASTSMARLPSGEPLPPGAYNPDVTQATIGITICVAGWTKTVRPPSSYTTKLKREKIAADGLSGAMSEYEEDHFIPLELGGAPRDPNNLWPEPWNGVDGAYGKDKAENRLHAEVCSGAMTLDEARRLITDPNQWH
jgi:hypothetical protein